MEKSVPSERRRGGYLEALLESSPYAIIAIDANGIITFVNKAAAELIACETQELVGKNIVTIYETEEKARETNRKLYLSGGIIHDHESNVKTKTGKIIPVRISAAHLKDHSGNYIGGVGFFETYRPWAAAEVKLQEYCQQLEAELEEWRDLCGPVFELLPGLSVTVVAGRLDGPRFERIRKSILEHIRTNKTRTVVIDLSATLTGDGEVATQLVKTVRMIQLVGAHCILVGIDSVVAHAIEPLIADVRTLNTFSSLQAGLEVALAFIGFEVVKKLTGGALGQDSRQCR